MAYDPYFNARAAASLAQSVRDTYANTGKAWAQGITGATENVAGGLDALLGKKRELEQLAGYNQPYVQSQLDQLAGQRAELEALDSQMGVSRQAADNLQALAGLDTFTPIDAEGNIEQGATAYDVPQGSYVNEDVQAKLSAIQDQEDALRLLTGAPSLRERREAGVSLDSLIGQQKGVAEQVQAQKKLEQEFALEREKSRIKAREAELKARAEAGDAEAKKILDAKYSFLGREGRNDASDIAQTASEKFDEVKPELDMIESAYNSAENMLKKLDLEKIREAEAGGSKYSVVTAAEEYALVAKLADIVGAGALQEGDVLNVGGLGQSLGAKLFDGITDKSLGLLMAALIKGDVQGVKDVAAENNIELPKEGRLFTDKAARDLAREVERLAGEKAKNVTKGYKSWKKNVYDPFRKGYVESGASFLELVENPFEELDSYNVTRSPYVDSKGDNSGNGADVSASAPVASTAEDEAKEIEELQKRNKEKQK